MVNLLISWTLQLHNIINQRESRLNFEIAHQQRKLATLSGRESTSMKTLTIMGLFFLPGTFLSSFFGMPFFNFNSGKTARPRRPNSNEALWKEHLANNRRHQT